MAVHPVVFLDVDTQRDFLAVSGAMPVPGAHVLIPIIQKLAAYAFTHGVTMVSTMVARRPDDPDFLKVPPRCVTGTRGQLKVEGTTMGNALIVPNDPDAPPEKDAVAEAKQIIIEKRGLDLFENPHAEEVFRLLAPHLVVVFGVATDHAVRAAGMGLCGRGNQVAVVSDAVKGLSEKASQKAFREMRRAGAVFHTAAEILSHADPASLTL